MEIAQEMIQFSLNILIKLGVLMINLLKTSVLKLAQYKDLDGDGSSIIRDQNLFNIDHHIIKISSLITRLI